MDADSRDACWRCRWNLFPLANVSKGLGRPRGGMQVQVLSKEKAKVLAEQYGCSLEFAEGYVDGEAWRGRRKKLPEHASVGIDEYSMGFRAAYFNRRPGPKGNFEKQRPGRRR